MAKVPVSDDQKVPEVCIIELGGTIGDIEGMPFIEAFRQFQFKAGRDNFCNVHVSLVPKPTATGIIIYIHYNKALRFYTMPNTSSG